MKIEKVKKFFKRTPLWISINVFKFSLILLFFVLVIGVGVFYRYIIFVQKVEPEDPGEMCPLQDEIYINVLNVWEENDRTFEESIDYYNIFSTNLVD